MYKTSTPEGILIVTPTLEGKPTNPKGTPSPHEVRLILLATNRVFQCLGNKYFPWVLLLIEASIFPYFHPTKLTLSQ